MGENFKIQKVYNKHILILEKKKDFDGIKIFNYVASKMGVDVLGEVEEILSIGALKISDALSDALTSFLKNCFEYGICRRLLENMGFLVLSSSYVTTEEEWNNSRLILADAFKRIGIGC